MKTFEGKVVIVTGASNGIGAEVARRFAKEGASLCITGRNAENLRKVGLECVENGSPKVVEVVADLAMFESCQTIVSKAVEQLQRIDVLINNAGMLAMTIMENVTLEDYDKLFNVNLKASFFLAQLAIPHLKKAKGCVVNISSAGSTTFSTRFMVYGMTKAAMDHFTKCTALGAVRTNILWHMNFTEEEQDKMFNARGELYPLGRLPTTTDVSDAVLFLASDKASMITGTCLYVDAGFTLKTV